MPSSPAGADRGPRSRAVETPSPALGRALQRRGVFGLAGFALVWAFVGLSGTGLPNGAPWVLRALSLAVSAACALAAGRLASDSPAAPAAAPGPGRRRGLGGSDEQRLLDELRDALAPPDRAPYRARVAALRERARAAAPTPPTPIAATRARRLRERPALVAAACLLLLFLAGGGFLVGRLSSGGTTGTTAGVVEYAGAIDGVASGVSGELRVTHLGIGREVRLQTDDLPILPTGRFYEVWFVGPEDTPESPQRISAGTFHPDAEGRSDVLLTAAVDPALFPVVSITAEAGDGRPGVVGPEVMRVRIP